MRTYTPKASDIERAWHVVDADGLVLGRLATEVARILRGKHKPIFAPHLDTGDHVIIVNADKVVLTSDKAEREGRLPPLGLPGRRSAAAYADLLGRQAARRPSAAPSAACCPKNRLGRQMLSKLKVYAGPDPSPRRPAAAAARARPARALALDEGRRTDAQAPHPDHRSPQAGRRPCPGPRPAPA